MHGHIFSCNKGIQNTIVNDFSIARNNILSDFVSRVNTEACGFSYPIQS